MVMMTTINYFVVSWPTNDLQLVISGPDYCQRLSPCQTPISFDWKSGVKKFVSRCPTFLVRKKMSLSKPKCTF